MKSEGLGLTVGMRLYLQYIRRDGITEVLPCNLIGFVEGQGLIIRLIGDAVMPMLEVGQNITTRMTVGDSRYAFSCEVLTVTKNPYPHIHLSYPQEISGVMMRSAPRFRMKLPLRLSLQMENEVVSVLISDISSTGACLLAELPLGEDSDTLNIEFRVPFDQTLISLPCNVCYVLSEQDEGQSYYRHGVAFEFNSDEEQLQLERFIELLIKKQYAVPGVGN